jgi:dTDP-4-amino-4,6-dideoxygalactose transaminase
MSTTSSLALFGGQPLFAQPIANEQLANRDPERFFALAEDSFKRRRLTNQGPVVDELEQRLCDLHGTRHCIAFANACFAIILALRELARPGASRVILPSLTFRGLPHLIRWAGLEPQFCDIDPLTHTLSPTCLAQLIDSNTAAVLAVDNVNGLCDIDALERLTLDAGIPLLLDAVYGIAGRYTTGGDDNVGSRGSASVFSLNASTLINGFEGGYLTTNDDQLAAKMRRQRNFGFGQDAVSVELGLNAKLNDLHAAMALSNLEHLHAIIADNQRRFASYQQYFQDLAWVSFADYSQSPGTFSQILLKVEADAPYSRDELIRILRAENALVQPYYSPPLHHQEPGTRALPITDSISRHFIQMPAGDPVDEMDIRRLAQLFKRLEQDAAAIGERLGRGPQ